MCLGAFQSSAGAEAGVMSEAAAAVVWAGPQSWNFTRALTWRKAAVCLLLLLLSIVVIFGRWVFARTVRQSLSES